MRKIMYNLGENMTIDQVNKILESFDADGDGKVSFEEFTAALMEEKRMGTEALHTGQS